MDGQGNIAQPTDIQAPAMSEWELCELFNVTAPTIKVGLKALCKCRVLNEYEIKRTIRLSDTHSMEVYNLETIIAIAFRIDTFGSEQVRNEVLKMICGRKKENMLSLFAHQFFNVYVID